MKPSVDSWSASVAFRDTLFRQQTIDQVRKNWRESRRADARLALRQYPKLESHRSCVLELAYEEYCFRLERGEDVEKSVFCRRFPQIHKSLARQIEVHSFLDGVPDLLPGPVAPLQLGSVVFDEFRVLEELGRGALARVYLCEQIGVGGRQVVLKIAYRGGYEADTLGRLNHTNIVPVYSVHEDPQTENSGICMPFQGRSTLCDVIDLAWQDNTPPASDEVIREAAVRLCQQEDRLELHPLRQSESYAFGIARIGVELAGALHHAHEQGIRHDDLKPSNVLLTPDGQVKLMDFNLSTSEQAHIALTGGTVPYMSPEQLRKVALQKSEADELDNRTDVFSLGVILYELLTGRLPFGEPQRDDSQAEIVARLLEQQAKGATPIDQLNPSVPRDVADHVMSCLAFDREKRPNSLPDWADQLQALRCPNTARHANSHLMRHLILCFVMTTVLLGGASLGFFHWIRSGQNSIAQEPPTASSAFEKGRFYMKDQRWAEAIEQFEAHTKQHSDGAAFACLSYCYGKLRNGHQSRTYRDMALETGFESAGFMNNAARSFVSQSQLHLFDKYIHRAIELAPDASTPRYNRARLEYLRYCADRANYYPIQGAKDIDLLRQRFPNHGQIAYRAVTLFAVVAQRDERYVDPAIEAMRVAFRRGFTRIHKNDDALKAIASDPRFSSIWTIAPETLIQDPFEVYMDPLEGAAPTQVDLSLLTAD